RPRAGRAGLAASGEAPARRPFGERFEEPLVRAHSGLPPVAPVEVEDGIDHLRPGHARPVGLVQRDREVSVRPVWVAAGPGYEEPDRVVQLVSLAGLRPGGVQVRLDLANT